LVVEWHLSVGNVNVDISLVLDGYPVAGVNAVARDLWFGVGGAAVNYASCIVRLGTIVSYRGVSRMLNPDMIPDAGDHVHFASVNPGC